MKLSTRRIACLTALGTLAVTAPAWGQGGPGSADSLSYRCHLLGEGAACWVLETTLRGDPVPGPYAQCLAGKGAGRVEALAAAATLGEHPTPPRPGQTQARPAAPTRVGAVKRPD